MVRLLVVLLLLLFIAAVVWRLIGAVVTRTASPRRLAKLRMVRCAHCDLYVPEDEAVRDGGDFYCCSSHQLLGRKGE